MVRVLQALGASATIICCVAALMMLFALGAMFPQYGIPVLVFVWVALAWALHYNRWF